MTWLGVGDGIDKPLFFAFWRRDHDVIVDGFFQ